MKKHNPIHPSEALREDFILPLGISEYRVAKDIGVSPRRINEIVKGKRRLTDIIESLESALEQFRSVEEALTTQSPE